MFAIQNRSFASLKVYPVALIDSVIIAALLVGTYILLDKYTPLGGLK